ncbi:MAG: 7-carboxy-7-deazaguanine synthase, partial [Planctomycetota bacterium]
GGEPLINKETPLLAEALLNERYTVLVETNGSCDISVLPKAAIKIMDLKCPDSNASPLMHWQNIAYLTPLDEVKFVLSSRKDYEWAKAIIQQHCLSEIARVLIGTASGAIPPKTVVQWLLEDNLNVRFQLQIHKYIWEPHARGV